MPNIELVIDTNVLKYASDETYSYCDDCIRLVNNVMDCKNIFICVDDSDSGHIFYEYRKHLKIGMLAYTMLLKCVSRIKFIPRDIDSAINKKINQTGIKKADRIFVRIAYKTNKKLLISDEHEDFTEGKRKYFKKNIGVSIKMAKECEF